MKILHTMLRISGQLISLKKPCCFKSWAPNCDPSRWFGSLWRRAHIKCLASRLMGVPLGKTKSLCKTFVKVFCRVCPRNGVHPYSISYIRMPATFLNPQQHSIKLANQKCDLELKKCTQKKIKFQSLTLKTLSFKIAKLTCLISTTCFPLTFENNNATLSNVIVTQGRFCPSSYAS